MSDLDFDLSKSLKDKSIGAIRLRIYGFLLMFNCNIGSKYAPLQDIRVEIRVTLNLTFQGFSRSYFKVSLDAS